MLCFRIDLCTGSFPVIGLALFLSYSPVVSAQIEQFSVAQCAQLEAALELNREQQRRGYKLKHELKIKAQQAQLEIQLHYHCQQPQALQQRKDRRTDGKTAQQRQPKAGRPGPSRPKTTRQPARPRSATLTMSVIAVKAPFQGAKQAAWLAFYQAPFYCFGVRQTERIRQCVEQRQQAQQRFEQQYNKPGTAPNQ
jgi:hypothetical protein